MELLQFALLIRCTLAVFYKEVGVNKAIRMDQVVYEEHDIPSKLTCVQKCFRHNAEMLYEDTKCLCFKRSLEHQDVSNPNHLEVTGLYYQSMEIIPDRKIWHGQRYDIIRNATEIKSDHRVTTFDHFTRQYIFNIDLKMTSFSYTGYKDIALLSNFHGNGRRIPYIYTSDNRIIRFSVGINGKYNELAYLKHHLMPLNQWVSWKTSQLKQLDGRYVYKIEMDGKQVYSVVNNQPESFKNVQVFVAKGGNPQPGLVRNM